MIEGRGRYKALRRSAMGAKTSSKPFRNFGEEDPIK
jgi:hypothetical protein